MGEKQIDRWGVVRVRSGRLAGIFEMQADALKRMRELSPAYIVCFGNGSPRPDDYFWEREERPNLAPLKGVTQH